MKQTYENFTRILNRSKEYEFEGHTVLVIRDYYSGDEIRLDFSKITPEIFDQIKLGDPVEEVWNICESRIVEWKEQAAHALMVMDLEHRPFVSADYELYNQVELAIEDYCCDHDLDRYEMEIEPENVLLFNPDAQ